MEAKYLRAGDRVRLDEYVETIASVENQGGIVYMETDRRIFDCNEQEEIAIVSSVHFERACDRARKAM